MDAAAYWHITGDAIVANGRPKIYMAGLATRQASTVELAYKICQAMNAAERERHIYTNDPRQPQHFEFAEAQDPSRW